MGLREDIIISLVKMVPALSFQVYALSTPFSLSLSLRLSLSLSLSASVFSFPRCSYFKINFLILPGDFTAKGLIESIDGLKPHEVAQIYDW